MSISMEAVQNALKNVLPRMITDGGGIEVVQIEGSIITLRFLGTCNACPSREISARVIIKNIIAEFPCATVHIINKTPDGKEEKFEEKFNGSHVRV